MRFSEVSKYKDLDRLDLEKCIQCGNALRYVTPNRYLICPEHMVVRFSQRLVTVTELNSICIWRHDLGIKLYYSYNDGLKLHIFSEPNGSPLNVENFPLYDDPNLWEFIQNLLLLQ